MDRLNPNLEYELIEAIKSDDVKRFHEAKLRSGININRPLMWLERRSGMRGFNCVQRTPLMMAATCGCSKVLKYILGYPDLTVNKTSISDGLTALDCACLSNTPNSSEICIQICNRLIPVPHVYGLPSTSASEHQDANGPLDQKFERLALDNDMVKREGNFHSGQSSFVEDQFGEGALAHDQNSPGGTLGPSPQRGGQNM